MTEFIPYFAGIITLLFGFGFALAITKKMKSNISSVGYFLANREQKYLFDLYGQVNKNWRINDANRLHKFCNIHTLIDSC
jgi:hypothetical protein